MSNPLRRDGNPRYVLRAYETADAARLATILHLAAESGLSRRRIAELWADRRPQDLASTAYRTIRARIGRGANLLEAAGIVRRDGDTITVLDWDGMAMVARNLTILENPDGSSIPPGRWVRRPEAPPELHPIQQRLERDRTANQPSEEGTP